MNSQMLSLAKLDKRHLWHPFTPQSEWENNFPAEPLIISRAKGIYLYDAQGRKYIDGISSLWANLHGHRNPDIDAAVKSQLKRVAHSTFLGLTHEPGIRLANELVQLAPKRLKRVFYSDNGSTAIEVALKMAFQYQMQYELRPPAGRRGGFADCGLKKSEINKTEFLALKNSYHGDTIGAVAVGGIELFHKKFKPLLFKAHFTMSPHCIKCPYKKVESSKFKVQSYEYNGEKPKPGDHRKETGCRWECLGEAENILKKNRKIVAAVIEPILQGAGGMIVMPPGYLWGFTRLCRKYRVLLIADEVATGFGRTGKMFAVEHENVIPDFLCLAKGISGGYLPLAVTMTSENVYRRFLGKADEFKTFYHGHTYTANPLACAAGRASLEIFKKHNVLKKIIRLSEILRTLLQELLPCPIVGDVRQIGLTAGVEIVAEKHSLKSFPFSLQAGKIICALARKNGIILRPLGDVIVLMPPLSIRQHELKLLVRKLKETIISFQLKQVKQ